MTVKNKKGLPILLLHGWGLDSSRYQPLIRLLVKKFRVLAPDLPGFGQEALVDESWSVPEYAGWVVDLLDKEKIRKVVVIGHSFGGRIGLELAANYPDRVEKLVLTGTPFLRRHPLFLFFAKLTAKSVKKLIPGKLKTFLYAMIRATDYPGQDPALRPVFTRVISHDQRELVRIITQPVLLVWGEADGITSVNHARALRKAIPQAKLLTLKEANHRLPYQEAAQFAKMVSRFI